MVKSCERSFLIPMSRKYLLETIFNNINMLNVLETIAAEHYFCWYTMIQLVRLKIKGYQRDHSAIQLRHLPYL